MAKADLKLISNEQLERLNAQIIEANEKAEEIFSKKRKSYIDLLNPLYLKLKSKDNI